MEKWWKNIKKWKNEEMKKYKWRNEKIKKWKNEEMKKI